MMLHSNELIPTVTCSQFHQRHTRSFFERTSFWQFFSSYTYVEKLETRKLEKAAKRTFVQKITLITLMKLTARTNLTYLRQEYKKKLDLFDIKNTQL